MNKILAIDDDRGILELIRRTLEREGYAVTLLENPLELESLWIKFR